MTCLFLKRIDLLIGGTSLPNYCVKTLALNKLEVDSSGAAPGCRHGPGRRCGSKETIAGLLAESPPWVPVKKQRHYVHAASPALHHHEHLGCAEWVLLSRRRSVENC